MLAQALDAGQGLGTAVTAKQHTAVLLELEQLKVGQHAGGVQSPFHDLRASWARPVFTAATHESGINGGAFCDSATIALGDATGSCQTTHVASIVSGMPTMVGIPEPRSERQVRPLATLRNQPEVAAQARAEAVDESDGAQPTAQQVARAVARRVPQRAELKLRAERKAGELLAEMPKSTGK